MSPYRYFRFVLSFLNKKENKKVSLKLSDLLSFLFFNCLVQTTEGTVEGTLTHVSPAIVWYKCAASQASNLTLSIWWNFQNKCARICLNFCMLFSNTWLFLQTEISLSGSRVWREKKKLSSPLAKLLLGQHFFSTSQHRSNISWDSLTVQKNDMKAAWNGVSPKIIQKSRLRK